MAIAPAAAVALLPLFGALLVGATYVVASRFNRRIGPASALLTAASPIFLYQLVQPVSDVPAAALWTAAIALVTGTGRRGPALGGLAAAAAIVVRPNLLPLAVPLALFLVFRPECPWRDRRRAAAAFGASAALGSLAVAWIQFLLYGSPFGSGYGTIGTMFHLDNVAPNAVRYATWLTETQTIVWVLALAAPFLLPGAVTGLLMALVLVTVACYLPYDVFDDWTYLRFLLPALPLLMTLTVASVDSIVRHWWRSMARPVVAVLAIALAVVYVREAEARNVFACSRWGGGSSAPEPSSIGGTRPPIPPLVHPAS